MYLGIELGTTRVKGVLVDDESAKVQSFRTHTWKDRKLVNGIYSYSEEDIHNALLDIVKPLVDDANGVICALGVSGMMHGLVALDKNGELLTNFRTWRSENTERAALELSETFGINVPARWSIAHLYQAILDEEPFVPYIAHITTLAGYVTYKLTGKFVLGIGDASGVFPVDYKSANYDKKLMNKFEDLIEERHLPWKLKNILPKINICTKYAGHVTQEGSKYLDFLVAPGTPVVPPEGDATTGMVVTNTIRPYHGSISAGTSAFLMLTLPKPLNHVYPIIDYVMSPTDRPVMMIHSNECCSLIDDFVDEFQIKLKRLGFDISKDQLLPYLLKQSENATVDLDGLTYQNFHMTRDFYIIEDNHVPYILNLYGKYSIPNYTKALLYYCLAPITYGLDTIKEEDIHFDEIVGFGGYFNTLATGQKAATLAIDYPVKLTQATDEGGALGMALLTAYCDLSHYKEFKKAHMSLNKYLDRMFRPYEKKDAALSAKEKKMFKKFIGK